MPLALANGSRWMSELALAKSIDILLAKAMWYFIINPLAKANGNEYGTLCNL